MVKQSLNEFDVFYISFDEPNCEKNYADLVNKIPWAQRTHGVKGFDSAHKACAKASKTDRFIIIDGDNIVNEKFYFNSLVRRDMKAGNHLLIFSYSQAQY